MDYSEMAKKEDALDTLAKRNGIDMPRLRGYHSMQEANREDIDTVLRDYIPYVVKRVIDNDTFCESTAKRCRKYLIYDYYYYGDGHHSFLKNDVVRIKWDKIHGKLRKDIKFAIKKKKKKVIAQLDLWNKYCGQPNILCVYSRCGGGNWNYFKDKIISLPGYITSVDDAFDATYLYSYFVIKEN